MNQKISQLIHEIQQYIRENEALTNLHDIEKDILLEKIRDLYSAVKLYPQLETIQTQNIVETVSQKPINEPIIELIEEPSITIQEESKPTIGEEIANSAIDIEFETKQKIDTISTPVSEPAKQENVPTVEQKVETGEPKQSTVETNKPQPQIKADLGTKLAKKPIANISQAIGINERFQFIKELFANDVTAYNSTIQTLNAMTHVDQAVEYISQHFNWDMENATVQRFLSIVERRYL